MVDERLPARIERIGVVVLGPPVHGDDRREGSLALGTDQPSLDPIASGVLEPDRFERSSRRRALAAEREHLAAGEVADPRCVGASFDPEPDLAAGSDPCVRDRAVERGQLGDGRRRELEPHQLVARLVRVPQEHRRPVRVPVLEEHGAGEPDRKFLEAPGREVPEPRPLHVVELPDQHEPLVARHRGPSHGLRPEPFVDDLAHGLAGVGVQDPYRWARDVALLRVAHREQRPVGREPARSGRPLGSHPSRARVTVDRPRRTVSVPHEDRVRLVVGQPERRRVRDHRQAHRPAVGHAEERARLATVERGDHPAAALITVRIEPPDHALAVGRQMHLLGPDATARGLPSGAGGEVPCPCLRAAALVRHDSDAIRGGVRPVDPVDARDGEASVPRRCVGHRVRILPQGSSGWQRSAGPSNGASCRIMAADVDSSLGSQPLAVVGRLASGALRAQRLSGASDPGVRNPLPRPGVFRLQSLALGTHEC